MYPSHYLGETQWNSPEVTSDQGYSSNDEDLEANCIHIRPKIKSLNNKITSQNIGPSALYRK
jgi:hypothetical protein